MVTPMETNTLTDTEISDRIRHLIAAAGCPAQLAEPNAGVASQLARPNIKDLQFSAPVDGKRIESIDAHLDGAITITPSAGGGRVEVYSAGDAVMSADIPGAYDWARRSIVDRLRSIKIERIERSEIPDGENWAYISTDAWLAEARRVLPEYAIVGEVEILDDEVYDVNYANLVGRVRVLGAEFDLTSDMQRNMVVPDSTQLDDIEGLS